MSKYPEGEIEWGIRTLEEMVEHDEILTNENKGELFGILIDAKFLLTEAERKVSDD